MTDENKTDRNINISDNEGDVNIGNVVSSNVQGDAVGGDKVGGDKVAGDKVTHHHQQTVFDQRGQQVGTQYNAGRDIIIGWLSKPWLWLFGLAAIAIIGLTLFFVLPPLLPESLPFPPAEEDETLIIIATFEETGAGQSLPHREIKSGIEQALGELKLDNPPRVEIHPAIISADNREAAEKLGNQYNASLIIWGTDTNTRVTVNYLNLKDPNTPVPALQLDETSRSQLADPQGYVQYITSDLPTQLTFFSLLAVGRSAYLQKDYSASITSLERAMRDVADEEDLPGLPEAYFLLSWLYQESPERQAEALRHYTKAIDLDYDPLNWPYNNRGMVYHAIGQNEQAIADYNKAIDLDPEYRNAYNNRANAYADLEQYDNAIADYNKAIDLDPEYALAYNNRAIAYADLEQYDNAIADYNKAIDLDPEYALTYNNRANVYADLEQYDNAIEDYTKAIDLDPEYALAYYNRAIAYADLKQYDNAIADYNKAIDLNPEDAIAYLKRGVAYHKLEQYDNAIEDYTKAIDLDPEYALAYYNRAIAYADLKQYDNAIDDNTKAIDLDPEYAFAYNNRGLGYKNLGQYEQAIEDYTKAIDLDPEFATTYYNRGIVYAKMGETEQATADLKQGRQLAEDADYPDWVQTELEGLDIPLQ